MTHDEMIAVIQAHKEGKKIQCKQKKNPKDIWVIDCDPNWDFTFWNYRVKPEPHYRPFKSEDEVMEAIKEHGMFVGFKTGNEPFSPLVAIADTFVKPYREMSYNFKEALAAFTFADGTPFGVKED